MMEVDDVGTSTSGPAPAPTVKQKYDLEEVRRFMVKKTQERRMMEKKAKEAKEAQERIKAERLKALEGKRREGWHQPQPHSSQHQQQQQQQYGSTLGAAAAGLYEENGYVDDFDHPMSDAGGVAFSGSTGPIERMVSPVLAEANALEQDRPDTRLDFTQTPLLLLFITNQPVNLPSNTSFSCPSSSPYSPPVT
ncbi:hypothetical protein BC829DRAFT_227959 [Chytridium lagenaria]|nr:hypothetical protein BC829DRAFT_227959 [Chytridium lagenaria]